SFRYTLKALDDDQLRVADRGVRMLRASSQLAQHSIRRAAGRCLGACHRPTKSTARLRRVRSLGGEEQALLPCRKVTHVGPHLACARISKCFTTSEHLRDQLAQRGPERLRTFARLPVGDLADELLVRDLHLDGRLA